MVKRRKANTGSNRSAAIGEWDQVEIQALSAAARLTRKHPAAKRRTVEASIREFGVLDPVTIDSANVIVDGHLRVEIARKLGFLTVPVIRISHLNDAELRTYAIAANKLPAIATYDLNAIRIELEEIRADLPTLDLTLTGYTIGEIDRIAGNHAAAQYDDLDEVAPPLPKPTSSIQRGALFQLGSHRLICGDSLEPETFARLMGDASFFNEPDPGKSDSAGRRYHPLSLGPQ